MTMMLLTSGREKNFDVLSQEQGAGGCPSAAHAQATTLPRVGASFLVIKPLSEGKATSQRQQRAIKLS